MAFQEYIIGKRQRLSWVDETSFATGGNMATNGEVIGLNATIEPDFNQNWQEILNSGSGKRTIEGQELGPLDLPFTLNFNAVDFKFLKYSSYNFTNTGTGPTTHTGTLINSIRTFKLEWAIFHTTPIVVTLTGCGVLNTTINFQKGSGDAESMISISLQCYAKSTAIGSSITTLASGSITRPPFHFRHAKVTKNDVEIVEVNNGEITIDNGVDPNDSRYCNATLNREVGEFIPKVHRISGRYNINLKDNTEFNQWRDGVIIPDCKLEFIKSATDDVVLGLDSFRIQQGVPPMVLDGITNTDIVYQCNEFAPIVIRDNLTDY